MSRVCPECGQEFPDKTARCPADGAKTFAVGSGDELVGTKIDNRFTITSLLGKGGMGAVYRAHQHSMDREVALKVMRRDLADMPDSVRRFFREAKAASRLRNPHIITVFDFGQTDDGLLYIVMELLLGDSLAEVLGKSRGPMSPERAVNIVRQVLSAIADAHANGVLHRDLKPDNIFLMKGEATTDFVKVLDFGIAKILGSEGTALTGTGVMFGTPTYMSPEQARGEELDARSDLYAVGVILFELLAGKPPFEEKTPMALLLKKSSEEAPSIYHVNPDIRIPGDLGYLVSQLLASKPEDRPDDAKEVMELLQIAMASSTEPGVPMPSVVVRRGTTEIVSTADFVEQGHTDDPTTEAPIVMESQPSIPPDRTSIPWKWFGGGLGVLAGVAGILFFSWGSFGEGEQDGRVAGAEPVRAEVRVPIQTDTTIAADAGKGIIGHPVQDEPDAQAVKDVQTVDDVLADVGIDAVDAGNTVVVKPVIQAKPVKKVKNTRSYGKKQPSRKKKKAQPKKDTRILDLLRRDK